MYQFQVPLRPWESKVKLPFNPLEHNTRGKSWVNVTGNLFDRDYHDAVSAEQAYDDVLSGIVPSLETLKFPNPKAFVSGQIHEHLEQWKVIMESSSCSDMILD